MPAFYVLAGAAGRDLEGGTIHIGAAWHMLTYGDWLSPDLAGRAFHDALLLGAALTNKIFGWLFADAQRRCACAVLSGHADLDGPVLRSAWKFIVQDSATCPGQSATACRLCQPDPARARCATVLIGLAAYSGALGIGGNGPPTTPDRRFLRDYRRRLPARCRHCPHPAAAGDCATRLVAFIDRPKALQTLAIGLGIAPSYSPYRGRSCYWCLNLHVSRLVKH